MNNELDKDVVNLTKAIRQSESGGKLDARGASGEYGGYQFTPDTWKAYSKEAGVTTPLEQASREDQNKVAYTKIKQWKDAGYNVGQVASMWNAGPGRPDAYKEGHTGVNEYGVAYDTPSYAEKVAKAYQQMKSGELGGTYAPPPEPEHFTPATTTGVQTLQEQLGAKEGGFLSDVGQAFEQTGTGINKAVTDVQTGQINPASGLLQGAGAIAGTAGDVVDATLSNIPVVGKAYEGATELLGGAIQGAMETAPGQKVQQWAAEHPEAAGNIGAVMDIASVFPLFGALKYGKTGATDAITGLTKERVVREASDELRSSLTQKPTRGLERAERRGLDPMGTIVKNPDYLPDIIERNGKYLYDTKKATENIQRSIQTDEAALQNLLASRVKQKGGEQILGFNINNIRERTIKDVMGQRGLTGSYTAIKKSLNDYFDSLDASLKATSGRNYISLNELNDIKRDVRDAINFEAIDPTGTLAKEAKFDAGQSLMRQVEEAAKKAGIEGVKDINKKMSNDIQAMDLLEFLGGRPIKSGGVKSGLVKSVAKTIPGVEGLVDYASRGVPSTATRKLKSKRPVSESGRKGLSQLGRGLVLSGQLQSEE